MGGQFRDIGGIGVHVIQGRGEHLKERSIQSKSLALFRTAARLVYVRVTGGAINVHDNVVHGAWRRDRRGRGDGAHECGGRCRRTT